MEDTDINGVISTPTFDNAQPWYVVHCQSGKEKYASKMLQSNLGLSVYLPEKKVRNKGEVRSISLFPGYFFVRADLQHTALCQINTSPGVLRLLGFDGSPQMVPAEFIGTLYTELTRLNEYSCVPFHPGDTVYVIDGPLRGLEAVFIGPTTPSTRVQVLLKFLGRLTKTEVDGSILEKHMESIKTENTIGRTRYTRGKGRKIHHQERKNTA